MFTHVAGIPATFHGTIHLRTREFGDISVHMTHFLIVHNYLSPSSLILVLAYLSKFTRLSQSNKHIYCISIPSVQPSVTQHKFILCNNLKMLYAWLIFSSFLIVGQLVEALHYKADGRGFDSRRCHWNFSLT